MHFLEQRKLHKWVKGNQMSVLKSRGDLKRLAETSGVDATTISRIIRGKTANPGVSTLAKIKTAAAELGITLSLSQDSVSRNADKKQTKSRKSQAVQS